MRLHQISDGRNVVQADHATDGIGKRHIRRHSHDAAITGMQRRLAIGLTVHFDLGMRRGLEALHDDEIDRGQLSQEGAQRGLWRIAQFMH